MPKIITFLDTQCFKKILKPKWAGQKYREKQRIEIIASLFLSVKILATRYFTVKISGYCPPSSSAGASSSIGISWSPIISSLLR